MLTWLTKVGDCLSQLFNVILLNGHPNESLSGRAYRTKSVWWLFIDLLFFFDSRHCENAYYNDLKYARELLAGRHEQCSKKH